MSRYVEVIPWLLEHADLDPEVEERLLERYVDGYAEYGVPLRANDPLHDGRDWTEEAKQELDDFYVYLWVAMLEENVGGVEEVLEYAHELFCDLKGFNQ